MRKNKTIRKMEELLEEYLEEHGHSKETFQAFIGEAQEALLNHAIKIDGTIIYDDNDYS